MDRQLLLGLYRQLLLIRRFEEGIIELYLRGLMPGLAHCCIGEEAVAVGVCAALRPEDYITSNHRGHGHLIARGGRVDRMMAEVLGKEAGYNRGRGGTMHIADVSLGMLGANGIVGGGLGIAVGAGWALKRRGSRGVSVVFYGDGAANQGVVSESMNMASIWKLPVVFICENNGYGQFTPASNVTGGPRLGARAEAFGLRATEAYGQEVLSVVDTLEGVLERVREGGGPEFIEFQTYRFGGHHVGDPGKAYRSEEEIVDWRDRRDPIRLFGDKLLADRICTPEDLAAIDRDTREEVDAAVEFAKAAPYPELSEVAEYVYP